VRARREFAPAGDLLWYPRNFASRSERIPPSGSLLVQRKKAKKAPENPLGCQVATAAARSMTLPGPELAARRLKQARPVCRAPQGSTDRFGYDRSTSKNTWALQPLQDGALHRWSGQHLSVVEGGEALHNDRACLSRRAASSGWGAVLERAADGPDRQPSGFYVLSLPPFFARAKKGGRLPGRIPGGLSRSENRPRSENPPPSEDQAAPPGHRPPKTHPRPH
jgi:hypothetical protein